MDIINFLRNLFLLKYLPDLGTNATFGLLFIFGVLTSFHCLGMCGGIAISQSVGKAPGKTETEESKLHTWFVPSSLYNLGRVISYSAVGGIVGGLGRVVSFSGILRGIVPIVGGLFMIIMAVNLLGIFPFLRRFNIRMPVFFAKKIIGKKSYGPFYVGLMSGLMPCGPLQMVQLYALGTGSVILGAGSAMVFAVGTVPALLILGAVNSVISKKYSTGILKASAVLVAVLGIVMIGRGFALSGISLSLPGVHSVSDGQNTAVIKEYSVNDLKKSPDKTDESSMCSTSPCPKSPTPPDTKITAKKDTETIVRENTNIAPNNSSTPDPRQTPGPRAAAAPEHVNNETEKNTPDIQTVTIKIQSGSYPPIVVQKGIPVRWIIIADKDNLNQCNNAILIPGLSIQKKLIIGENVVEFTPSKAGEIPYTCWMGMIRSKITVVDDLKKASN